MNRSEQVLDRLRSSFPWLVALLLIVLSVAFIRDANGLSHAGSIGLGPGAVPRAVAILMLVFCVGYALSIMGKGRGQERRADGADPLPAADAATAASAGSGPAADGGWVERARRSPVTYMVVSFVALALVDVVGFFLALAALTLGCGALAKVGSPLRVLLLTGGVCAFAWVVFAEALNIYFPLGMFE